MWAYRTDPTRRFMDRRDAGRQLAAKLAHLRHEQPVVLGLARGGVVVAAEIARELGAPLGVLVARKLGAPQQPELGIGAVAPNGVMALNQELIARLGIRAEDITTIVERETAEIGRRLDSYAGDRPLPNLKDRAVLIIDDGLATGYTALAAVRYVRSQEPKRVVLAIPVCASQAMNMFSHEVDELVCCEVPEDLLAVGYWYEDFAQTTDEEVLALLADQSAIATSQTVRVTLHEGYIEGDLTVPSGAKGLVIFAHGSGSSRHSSRNKFVAERLNDASFGTLLIDLLTLEEEHADRETGHIRFDIPLLADRLEAATRWAQSDMAAKALPIGYFGASTGAAAALISASRMPEIQAVVSRGGRPDLAGPALQHVATPTLLIVGSRDEPVISLNQQAYAALRTEKEIQIVEGATHLFPEPGALGEVARLAITWFGRYLG